MTNLHPILVHFPIAFLGLYAVLELIRFRKILALPYWFYIKALLVILGALSTVPTIFAGILIKHGFSTNPLSHKIINLHETFAVTTSIIFGILAVGYLISWIETVRPLPLFFQKLRAFILIPTVSITLALIGLLAVTITGALGASIVYGPNLDPAVNFIYHLLIK